MNNEAATLLPCPFCGGTDLNLSNGYDEDANWVVVCGSCKSSGTFCVEKSKATSRWNARVRAGGDGDTQWRKLVTRKLRELEVKFNWTETGEVLNGVRQFIESLATAPPAATAGDAPPNPWARLIGKYKDDPSWQEFDMFLKAYREKVDQAYVESLPAPTPSSPARAAVTLAIPTCGVCPFIDHSGAFTPGGAKDICGHREAADHFAPFVGPGNELEHYHWKHWIVDRETAPPEQCPLRTTKEAGDGGGEGGQID